MIIDKINFPIYDVLIIFSIIVGAIYIYISVNKEGISKKNIIIYFALFFFIILLCGKLYTFIEFRGKGNIWSIGFTGYGGLIGAILSAYIYGKLYRDNRFFKYTIISLPLIYGFAKLSCFFNGCCIGIPYNGPFAVTYVFRNNDSFFPIQLVETISFVFLFQICNLINRHKNVIYITLILTFLLKFLLDFLRYSHLYEFLSNNQKMSIILCFITIFIYFINRYKKTS